MMTAVMNMKVLFCMMIFLGVSSQGYASEGQGQGLTWPVLSEAIEEVDFVGTKVNESSLLKLREISEAREWKVDPDEKALSYLVDVLSFMDGIVSEDIKSESLAKAIKTGVDNDQFCSSAPSGWSEIRKYNKVCKSDKKMYGDLYRQAKVVVTIEGTRKFIENTGKEPPGNIMGVENVVYIPKVIKIRPGDSLQEIPVEITANDILYGEALFMGYQPKGLGRDFLDKIISFDQKKTVRNAIAQNMGFRDIKAEMEAAPGQGSFLICKDMTKPYFFMMKVHTGCYKAYAMPLDDKWVFLMQLDQRSSKNTYRKPVELKKGTFGMVLQSNKTGWEFYEKNYYRGQNAWIFAGSAFNRQPEGIKEEKIDFIRLVVWIAMNRQNVALPENMKVDLPPLEDGFESFSLK